MRTLNCILILLSPSSDKESPTDSDLNDMEAESPKVSTATGAEGDSPYNPKGEFPVRTQDDGLPSQSRGGVTNEDDVQLHSISEAAGVTIDAEDCPDQLPLLRVKTSKAKKTVSQ